MTTRLGEVKLVPAPVAVWASAGYRLGRPHARWVLVGLMTLALAFGAKWVKGYRYHFMARNFREVVPDQVYAGAFQYPMPLERILRKYHIKTVLSLMPEGFGAEATEREVLAQNGVEFRRLPIPTNKSHPEMTGTVEDLLSARIPVVEQAAEILADPQNYPVFVHCQGGRPRTGAVVAIFRVRYCGWTERNARKELKNWGGMDRRAWWPSLALHDFSTKHGRDSVN